MRIWIGAIALGMVLGMPAGGVAWAIAPQIIEGELTEDDETFGDDTPVDIYQFEGKAGETVAVELISDDFDARLSIFHNGELVAGDDDSGHGSNALVIVELPADGTYYVGANAAWSGQRGWGQYQVAWRSPTDLDRRRFEVSQLTRQGRQFYHQAKLQEALALFQRAKEIYEDLGDRHGEGMVLSHSSLVYADLAEYDQGIAAGQAALAIRRELGDRFGQSTVLTTLGVIYGRQGQFAKALDSYEIALPIRREFGDRRGEGSILNNMAFIYGSQGQYAEALARFEDSLVIIRESGNRQGEGLTLSNMAGIYTLQGDNERALAQYREALAILREVGNPAMEASLLNNMGAAYDNLGQYDDALAAYQASLVLLRQVGSRAREGATLNNIGLMYQNQGKYREALTYYGDALKVLQNLGDRPSQVALLNNLGFAHMELEEHAQAEVWFRQSLTAYEAMERDLREDDDGRVAFFETQDHTYSNLEWVLAAQEKSGAALEVADRSRGRSLTEFLSPKAQQQGRSPFSLDTIKRLAREQNATLLVYSIVRTSVFIWVVSPSGNLTFRQVNPTEVGLPVRSIGMRVRSSATFAFNSEFFAQERYRFVVSSTRSNGGSSWLGNPQDLKLAYQTLIQPIEEHLPKGEGDRLIIVPHRELSTLPFAALIDSQDRFLVDRYAITVTPSLQILNTVQQKPAPTTGTPLVVGNPDPMPDRLSSLPGSEREAQAIAQSLNTSPFIGEQATEATIKQRIDEASVLHFATHGVVANSDRDLRNSWLALAETDSGTEDGKLTLTEIFNRTLNAQLAVLSACNTNTGEVTGEGVLGLARAFLKAGVPAVVASLWQVPDQQTQILMEAFYEELLAGETYANALRAAQLKVRSQSPNPRDWAAFMVIGDGDRTLKLP